ncbi:hypothetical protein ACOSQ2_008623 [Xanthoceras sorbifolium]
MFMIISLILWLAVYDRIIIPAASKIRGNPSQLGVEKRMGAGVLFSVAAMASWATAESVRRRIAIEEGVTHDPQAVVHMSVMWQKEEAEMKTMIKTASKMKFGRTVGIRLSHKHVCSRIAHVGTCETSLGHVDDTWT